jgi:hypothetical protein
MSNMVIICNEKAAEIFNIHTNPGHDTRRLAIIHIAMHDALNSIVQQYDRYAFQVILNPDTSADAAVLEAAYHTMYWAIEDVIKYQAKLIAESLPGVEYSPGIKFDESQCKNNILGWYTAQMDGIADGVAKSNGKIVGQQSANAIIVKRSSDKSDTVDILSKIPKDGTKDGEFRVDYFSTPIAEKNKLIVNFDKVTNFVINNRPHFRQKPDYANQSDWETDLNEVNDLGTPDHLIDQQLNAKVEFWSNLKPHIVWNNIAKQIIQANNLDAWATARVFALIHTAMADGAILLFEDIYKFMKWRPITAIRLLLDPDWNHRKPIPRVPEYPTSFGIFGGSTGQILENVFPGPISINLPTIPIINYSSITDALNDNILATIYAGRNFRKTMVDSTRQGRLIGKYIYENEFLGV